MNLTSLLRAPGLFLTDSDTINIGFPGQYFVDEWIVPPRSALKCLPGTSHALGAVFQFNRPWWVGQAWDGCARRWPVSPLLNEKPPRGRCGGAAKRTCFYGVGRIIRTGRGS